MPISSNRAAWRGEEIYLQEQAVGQADWAHAGRRVSRRPIEMFSIKEGAAYYTLYESIW